MPPFSVEDSEGSIPSLDWVAGFYDGEGAISIQVRRHTVDFQASFTQAYHPLLEQVKAYFDRHGINGGHLYQERGGRISRLVFDSNEAVLKMPLHLLPSLALKKRQAQATVDYLSGRLTGNEFLAIMNQEIDSRRRRGRNHNEDLPWTRGSAIEKSRQQSLKLARSAYQAMRNSPTRRELERARAIERNHRRGDKTRRAILLMMVKEPMSPSVVAEGIGTTMRYARIIMKELYEMGLLVRSKDVITRPFEYAMSQKGHDYLSTSMIDLADERKPTT